MWHLKVNPRCDCIYHIDWVVDHCTLCYLNRNYTHCTENTELGAAISVKLPNGDYWACFTANDQGWLYVYDHDPIEEGLEEVPIAVGICVVEDEIMKRMARQYVIDLSG